MPQTTLSVRMDEETKKQFDAFCEAVGMNASVAVNIFAKAVLREKRIPFEISATEDLFHSAVNQSRLKNSVADIAAGTGLVSKTMTELETMANE